MSNIETRIHCFTVDGRKYEEVIVKLSEKISVTIFHDVNEAYLTTTCYQNKFRHRKPIATSYAEIKIDKD